MNYVIVAALSVCSRHMVGPFYEPEFAAPCEQLQAVVTQSVSREQSAADIQLRQVDLATIHKALAEVRH